MASPNHKSKSASHDLDSESQPQKAAVLNSSNVQQDSDDTSSSGTSSDEEEMSSIEEEDNTLPTETKPIVVKPPVNNDLRSRLSSFLPQMEKANKELEDAGDALNHRIDDVGENEDRYIEMNLGLGVLSEEQDGNDIKFEDSSTSDSDEESSGKSSELLKSLNSKDEEKRRQHKIEEI